MESCEKVRDWWLFHAFPSPDSAYRLEWEAPPSCRQLWLSAMFVELLVPGEAGKEALPRWKPPMDSGIS